MAYETPWAYNAQGQPLDATGRVISPEMTTELAANKRAVSIWEDLSTNPSSAFLPAYNKWSAANPWTGATSPTTVPGGGGGAGVWEEAGYRWYYDSNGNPVPFQKIEDTMTPYQQAQIDLARSQQQYQQQQPQQQDYSLQIAQMNQQNQQAQLAWQQQRWQQELAQEQKNYLAQLSANPRSWLEYAAAAGQSPAIQPWMLPLMPQDYSQSGVNTSSVAGGGQPMVPDGPSFQERDTRGIGLPNPNAQPYVYPPGGPSFQNYNPYSAGQLIPGWSATNMQGMPNLINPSAQYWARMGPTAQQQYLGYQQADTGALPAETQWRMWNMAPPSGNRSLVQTR